MFIRLVFNVVMCRSEYSFLSFGDPLRYFFLICQVFPVKKRLPSDLRFFLEPPSRRRRPPFYQVVSVCFFGAGKSIFL